MKLSSIFHFSSLFTVVSAHEGWINNEKLRARATDDITTKPAARYSLNLDLPASERWNDIAAVYKASQMKKLFCWWWLDQFCPKLRYITSFFKLSHIFLCIYVYHINCNYWYNQDEAYRITDYLKSQVPGWLYPIMINLAADIEPYFVDYGDEMIALASALGLEVGEIGNKQKCCSLCCTHE